MTLAFGTRLGPYEILSPLGAGGMGEVYRARDTRLDRDVAIKVLPERTARDEHALSRFRRETMALAALSHPNILMILDVGDHEGISYAVMELLEGETLRERLRGTGVDAHRALEIAAAIADGLAAAHARDIVHRDLKPENLFLTREGVVKILDFGLARTGLRSEPSAATVTAATQPGVVLGTVNYMSPEQVRGEQADSRCDIFSLGCVLYEMLSGRPPFARETAPETMTAILRQHPKLPSQSTMDLPPGIDPIVMRCLEKRPEERFNSARDLAFSLRSALAHSGEHQRSRKTGLGWLVTAGVLGLMALVAGALYLIRGGQASRAPIDSIAVLPFVNQSGNPDDEYFSDGMTDELASALMKVPGLRVAARSSAFTFKGKNAEAQEVGAKLNVATVLEGTLRRAGQKLRVTAQLVNTSDGLVQWSEKYEREVKDVFAVQDDITEAIVDALQLKLGAASSDARQAARPVSAEAHDLYLRGRFFAHKHTEESLRKALDYFARAIEKDPRFAPAYTGIAFVYIALADAFDPPKDAYPKARTAALKAMELDPANAEAHTYQGLIQWYFDRDSGSAEAEFVRALRLNPHSAEAHYFHGEFLCGAGRRDEGLAEMNQAIALDPLSAVPSWSREYCLAMARRYDEAIEQHKLTAELDPNFFYVESPSALAHREKGLLEEALTEYQRLQQVNRGRPAYGLAITYARMGKMFEAREVLRQYLELSQIRYVSPDQIALIYAALGDKDEAFAWLDRAEEARSGSLITWILGSADYDPLRSDPRFEDLLRRLGLPQPKPTPTPLGKRGERGITQGKIMLVVLPFENLSRDPEQEYFSDGLTEEMITQLGRLNPQKLGVIARSSAMHYKNTAKTIDAIGRELGVAYVIEGSVRRAGDRVRITAQLIQVSDQTHLWAENYERDLNDILALQSDVAQRIAGSLSVELLSVPAASARVRTISPAAHEAYLKGRFHWNKRTPDGLQKAVDYFEQAVSLAPDWPLGYVGLADAYLVMPYWASVRPSEAIPKARAAGTKALALDESLGEAHATMAVIAADYDWNWPTAEREYERALALSPNYATAHQWYAESLMHVSRHDQAINEMIKAQELDPLSLMIGVNVGLAYYYAGDFEEADIHLRKTLEIDPDFPQVHAALAKTSALRGRFGQAVAEAREAVRLSHNAPMFAALLGYAYARAGQAQEARKVLDELAALSKEAYVAPIHFVHVHAGLDERDHVIEWLESAYRNRDLWLTYTLPDPLLAPMHSDPRFVDLVRRVGLPMPRPIPAVPPSGEGRPGGTP